MFHVSPQYSGQEWLRRYTYDRRGWLKGLSDEVYTSEQTGSCATAESAMDANHGACVPPHVETSPVVASATYDYDEVGNCRNTLRGDVVEPGNRLAVFDDYHFTYDDEGDLTRKWKGTDDLRLSWNSLGQMDTVWRYQQGTVRYGYDASGRRVRRTAPNGTVTRYLYTGDDLTMELNAAGQPIRVYTYYPGVDRPQSVWVAATQQNYYYATDNPGHVEGLINSANQLVNEYHYTPWGEPEAVAQTVEQPLRYMAREYDEVTGLYQVRARWYDPQQGRFVSEDPIGLAGGLNPYAYADNSPTNRWDPTGLDSEVAVQLEGTHNSGCPKGWTMGDDGVCRAPGRIPTAGTGGTGGTAGTGGTGSSTGSPSTSTSNRPPSVAPKEPEPLPSCDNAGDAAVKSLVADLGFLTAARAVQGSLVRSGKMTGPLVTVQLAKTNARKEALGWLGGAALSAGTGAYFNEGKAWYSDWPLLGSADKFATMLAVCLND